MTDTSVDATTAAPPLEQEKAERGFNRSILISAVRCTLTYVILPFIAPLVGFAPGVGPTIGIVVGIIALVANVVSIRRLRASQHRLQKPLTLIHYGVIVLLLILLFFDIRAVL